MIKGHFKIIYILYLPALKNLYQSQGNNITRFLDKLIHWKFAEYFIGSKFYCNKLFGLEKGDSSPEVTYIGEHAHFVKKRPRLIFRILVKNSVGTALLFKMLSFLTNLYNKSHIPNASTFTSSREGPYEDKRFVLQIKVKLL